jgi:hypothetical protein
VLQDALMESLAENKESIQTADDVLAVIKENLNQPDIFKFLIYVQKYADSIASIINAGNLTSYISIGDEPKKIDKVLAMLSHDKVNKMP